MSFPRYPKYKNSGVDWLGEVPEHWRVKRLRFVAEFNPSKSEVISLDRAIAVTFLPMEAIGDDGRLNLDKKKSIWEVESGYTYLRNGDVVIAKITPCYENGKGALMRDLMNGIGFGTTELIVARPKPAEIIGTYLHYLFISPDFRSLGESHMYGAGGQKRVPDAFVRNFATAFPPLAEQTQIAAFLDRETAKIDDLMAEQRRLMELLKEKRQAVISHAVTQGLNPSAPMKPSGIEWIGDIPEHWILKSLSMASRRISVGLATSVTEFYRDEGIPIIRNKNIKDGYFDDSDMLYLDEVFAESQSSKVVFGGDIIAVHTGSNLGLSCIVPDKYDRCQTFTTLIVTPGDELLNRYFTYCMNSPYGVIEVDRLKFGFGKDNLNVKEFKCFKTLIPPFDEQKAIVSFLDRETSKSESLVTEAQRAIDLLQERRTALISAAVTGQIDVRHIVEKQAA